MASPTARQVALLAGRWAVCRLAPAEAIPEWATRRSSFSSVVRTPRELSIVVPDRDVPPDVVAERDFALFEIDGPIPFAETGVLAAFAAPIAAANISLFALATYDTDYVLVRADTLPRAIAALEAVGWHVARRD